MEDIKHLVRDEPPAIFIPFKDQSTRMHISSTMEKVVKYLPHEGKSIKRKLRYPKLSYLRQMKRKAEEKEDDDNNCMLKRQFTASYEVMRVLTKQERLFIFSDPSKDQKRRGKRSIREWGYRR